jgi:hypothetical protein
MEKKSPEHLPPQIVSAGRDAKFIGRDSITKTSVSVNIFFVLIAVLSLGGASWLLGMRINLGQTGIKINFQNQSPDSHQGSK